MSDERRDPPKPRDPDVWFEPKRYGLGAGLPVAWQGWVLMIGYFAILVAASPLLPRYWWAYMLIVIAATAAFLAMTAAHTRGGWRWRWGEDDD